MTHAVDHETGEITALVPRGQQQTALSISGDEIRRQTEIILHQKGSHPAFPQDMTAQEAVALARLALAYGFDPLAGELILYQHRPYVTIDGRLRVANNHPMMNGLECVPATEAERAAFRCGEHEHLWVARVWRKDRRLPNVGYGRAGGSGDKNPVSAQHAQEMAQKRAKHRALRDAFALPLPGYEEQEGDDATYEQGVVIDATAAEPEPAGPSREQSAAIHAKVGELGWDDNEYRRCLRELFSVESSSDLTPGLAASFLEFLGAMGEHEEKARKAPLPAEVVAELRDLARRCGLTAFQLDFLALRECHARVEQLTPAAARQLVAMLVKRLGEDVAEDATAETPPDQRLDAGPTDEQMNEYAQNMMRVRNAGLDEAAYETSAQCSSAELDEVLAHQRRDLAAREREAAKGAGQREMPL